MFHLRNSVTSAPLLLVAVLAACSDPQPTTGTLVVAVEGLPSGANASIRVTGPNEFSKAVRQTETLEMLGPGSYTVRAAEVIQGGALYLPALNQLEVALDAGEQEATPVSYGLASGTIELTVTGLPPGELVDMKVRRTDGFSRAIVNTGLVNLPVGTYTLHVDSAITTLGDRFGPSEALQTFTVPASLTPIPVTVEYTAVTGILQVTVNGLPAGLSFNPITVSGPNGFSRSTNASTSYHGLEPGTYTIGAATASGFCPTMYVPNTPSQTFEVVAGTPAARAVDYAEGTADPANLNLRILHAKLVQVVQDSAGTVPMIANRGALMRVFGLANQCNTATPNVRVTLSSGQVFTATPQESSVRTLVDESTLLSTWNVDIPGNLIQTGLSFTAEIDPTNAYAETNETDNVFPATGQKAVSVAAMPPVGVRFIPIAQPTNGTPALSADNVDQYMEFSRKIHPVSTYDVVVGSPMTTFANIATGNDQNSWITILQEVAAAQQSAQNSGTTSRFFHGIVQVPYNGGIGGIAFIGGKAGVSWHHLPSASEVVAHELGHNFGRQHAPCGGPAGPDPNYPYGGGRIGQYGYDAATQTLKGPSAFTDIMGYCQSVWISDYMYKGMLNNLLGRTTLPYVAGSQNTERVLLVWGSVRDGKVVLEPAFEIDGKADLPAPGPHLLRGLASDGSEAFNVSFAGGKVADLPDGSNAEIFAFTVPVSMLRGKQLESLQLTARGQTVRNRVSVAIDATTPDPQLRVTRASARTARVRWDAARFPVAMVRDARTGDVLAFARGGDALITTDTDQVEVNVSNRVRSAKMIRAIQ